MSPPADASARAPQAGDAAQLASLMLSAYRGTTDDGGETAEDAVAEVTRLLTGAYGRFDADASEVIVRNGEIVAATLITHHQGAPLLAFSMTAPAWKRQGLARAGLMRAMARLAAAGHARLTLVVTTGNTPAEALYMSMGFSPDP